MSQIFSQISIGSKSYNFVCSQKVQQLEYGMEK